MPAPISPAKIAEFDLCVVREGMGTAAAARKVGVGQSWAYDRVAALKAQGRIADYAKVRKSIEQGPIPYASLNPSARRAWDDFGYFRLRYMGITSTPWQVEAAEKAIAALESDRREYVVLNVAPGAGKTTLMSDIAAWMTVKHRSLRGLIGSGTQPKAEKMLRLLRQHLDRAMPVRADERTMRLGQVDAEATLAADFGLFRPLDRTEPWRADALLVVQPNFELTSQKEFTWAAYGLDTDYLGDRVDFMLWDDAVIPKDYRTLERIEMRRENFDTVTESRLEPNGALFLVGQRINANDLYRHCLDKVRVPDEDLDAFEEMSDAERVEAEQGYARQYEHIVYPAHFDDRCAGDHRRTAPPYPQGCLLDPRRLPWSDLQMKRLNDPSQYATWFQQEDGEATDVLVSRVWIDGGTDPVTGVLHYPAWDENRGLAELPRNLAGPKFSFVTVDPSPTRMWACVASGTRVATRRGEIPIESVRSGDWVVTRAGWRQVEAARATGRKPVLAIGLSNGRTLRVTADHRVLLADGRWVEAQELALGVAVRGVRSAPHVLPMRDDFQVGRIDAAGLAAQVVKFALDRRTPVPQHPVREPVGQALTRGCSDSPVGERAGVFRRRDVDAGPPDPAPILVDRASLAEPGLIWPRSSALVQHPVPADVAQGGLGATGSPARTSLHVASIASEPPIDTFDLQVQGCHEFTAEGVIVHNCQWWVAAPEASNSLFLMDLFNGKMTADEFLDWRANTGEFVGLAQEWQERSARIGLPITQWIVERNGAQRFLLQYDHVRRWVARHATAIVPHTTAINKNDPEYGVYMLREPFRSGRVNLPKKGEAARLASMKLADQVCRYPHGWYDDQVMAMWFGVSRLPQLTVVADPNAHVQHRPSWAAGLNAGRRLMSV